MDDQVIIHQLHGRISFKLYILSKLDSRLNGTAYYNEMKISNFSFITNKTVSFVQKSSQAALSDLKLRIDPLSRLVKQASEYFLLAERSMYANSVTNTRSANAM